jgi:hypothetical protein
MDCVYFPVIAETDYAPFKAILRDELPSTHEEWLKRHASRVAMWSKTHKIVDVEVNPAGLSTYLKNRNKGADLNQLYVFAELVGRARKI